MEQLLVVVIKKAVVNEIIPCDTFDIQEKVFKDMVFFITERYPEEKDYENGYYEIGYDGSICMTSIQIKE